MTICFIMIGVLKANLSVQWFPSFDDFDIFCCKINISTEIINGSEETLTDDRSRQYYAVIRVLSQYKFNFGLWC